VRIIKKQRKQGAVDKIERVITMALARAEAERMERNMMGGGSGRVGRGMVGWMEEVKMRFSSSARSARPASLGELTLSSSQQTTTQTTRTERAVESASGAARGK